MSEYAVLYYVGYGYLLWCLYLAVMALKQRWSTLSIPVRAISLPLLGVALFVDLTFNMIASIPFADMPQEFTFTQRMKRYIDDDWGWRASVARVVCKHMLNPFDAEHC